MGLRAAIASEDFLSNRLAWCAHLRRAADRLRGGSDAPSGARWHVAGI